jgi:tetratricopeptide (TPR) repeat protein
MIVYAAARREQFQMKLGIFCGLILLSSAWAHSSPPQAQTPSEEERLRAALGASQDPAALADAYRNMISFYLRRGGCDEAQESLSRARDRRIPLESTSFLLEIGRCLERKAPERARLLYNRVMTDFPDAKDEMGDPYADSARRRLIWLSDDRSWRVKTRSQLVNILSSAIRKKSFRSLQKYASKVNFIFGACQSEFLNSDPDEILSFLEENQSDRVRAQQGVWRFPYNEAWYTLETRGWSAPYDYIYLLVQAIPGGWEWIGAIYCDEPLRR